MSPEQSVNPEAIEQTKQQIRGLVDELSALSRQELPAEVYYAEFLKRVVEALAAIGGAVWLLEGNQFKLAYQINLQRSTLDQEGEHQQRHARLLAKVAQSGEGQLVPPHSGGGTEDEGANPTELLLVLAPLKSDQQTAGVVEIFQRPTAQPNARRGYLRFLLQMCELAGDWLKSRQLQEYTDQEVLWRQVDQFSRSAHESLDLRLTAYKIANEAQRVIGCDRVSVAILKGRRCKIEAVSGQDTFDNRSNVVTLLGKLATKVLATGEPLWYTGSTEDLPPQLEEVLHEYVDFSHSKTVVVLPLAEVKSETDSLKADEPESDRQEDPEWIGALVAEQVEDVRPRELLAPRLELIVGHTARALTNARKYNTLFMMPVWRTIGHARWMLRARTLPKTVTIAGLVLLALFLAVVVPSRFDLEGRGQVQPVDRRDVFVNVDGVVTQVHVEHGQEVQAGALLVQLRNTDLEVRLADVRGEMLAAGEQLRSINERRLSDDVPRDEMQSLAGQALQVRQRLKSLEAQVGLMEAKRKELTVTSPIAGRVISWDVQRQLMHRPVATGQVLLTVADPSSDWELEVFMPEKRMGHIARALEKYDEPLEVEYFVATDPTQKFHGTVRKIHGASEMHDEHGQAVSMLVEIQNDELNEGLRELLRPGATVTAKVHCGYRSIGYVWLHDFFEFVQSKILFYF